MGRALGTSENALRVESGAALRDHALEGLLARSVREARKNGLPALAYEADSAVDDGRKVGPLRLRRRVRQGARRRRNGRRGSCVERVEHFRTVERAAASAGGGREAKNPEGAQSMRGAEGHGVRSLAFP